MLHSTSTLSVTFSSLSLCLTRNTSTYQFRWGRTTWNKKKWKLKHKQMKILNFLLQFFEFICKFHIAWILGNLTSFIIVSVFYRNCVFTSTVRIAKLYDTYTDLKLCWWEVQGRWDCYSVTRTEDFIGKWEHHMHLGAQFAVNKICGVHMQRTGGESTSVWQLDAHVEYNFSEYEIHLYVFLRF